MQQTDKYKLNLIETSDPFSPNPLNDNARTLDAAVARCETANCLVKLGSWVTKSQDQTVDFDLSGLDAAQFAAFIVTAQANHREDQGSAHLIANGNQTKKINILWCDYKTAAGYSVVMPAGNDGVMVMGHYYFPESSSPMRTIGDRFALDWKKLTKLSFVGYYDPGAKFSIYGLKA